MVALPADLLDAAKSVLQAYENAGLMISTAESCTGGLIAGTLTAVAGSSSVVDRGFVTYTNGSKIGMLSVPSDLFETVGAVSEQVAECMVIGALAHSSSHVAVAVTGVAGPGQSENKPAGLVYIGIGRRGETVQVTRHHFDGDRDAVRHQTVASALQELLRLVEQV